MSAPVWVLSVDLQTKSASFTSGMSDAAKSARGAFTEIKSGSGEMGREVGSNMSEARHGVMMLGEEFGVHLPRGLTTFIASLGPVGAAMEAAFPFLAIILGATLLLEHLASMHEAGEKLTGDQMRFGTAAQMAFNSLDDKLLQSGIRADELRNNHIAALHKQLELIDHQSMAELAKQFGELAKSADTVFADLKSHWYSFGIGSAGAKHALDEFQQKYDALLAQGKDSEASDLLKGTRESAQKVLDLQNQAKNSTGGAGDGGNQAKLNEHEEALNKLKASGVGFTEKEVQAQATLVDALNAQVTIQGKLGEIKKVDQANATLSTAKEGGAEAAAAARAAIESQLRMGEQAIAADRAIAASQLDIQRGSIADREAVDVAFANREMELQLESNQKQIAALDKLAKDYPNQLKAMHEKAAEITQANASKIAEIQAKSQSEQAAKDLQTVQQSEREKIEATRQGSSQRLAAIDAALKAEQAANTQDTTFYRDLMTQRVEAARQEAQEEAKVKSDLARLEADNDQKMGELSLAAAREHQALLDSATRMSDQKRMAEALQNANEEFAIKQKAFAKEVAALDKSGRDYTTKLKEIQNKEKELVQEHENDIAAIKDKARAESDARILAAEKQFQDSIASGLTQSIMGHKSFAATMTNIGNQVVTGMIENALKSMLASDMTRESDAAFAARKAYTNGEMMGPAGVVLGPVYAAAAFAGVMAFQSGTDSVPGIGSGDRIPAMLEPGEGVVPGGVMDNLRAMARNGTMGGGNHTHVHTQVHFHASALDADGMDKVLAKHGDAITKHVSNQIRRMNR